MYLLGSCHKNKENYTNKLEKECLKDRWELAGYYKLCQIPNSCLQWSTRFSQQQSFLFNTVSGHECNLSNRALRAPIVCTRPIRCAIKFLFTLNTVSGQVGINAS